MLKFQVGHFFLWGFHDLKDSFLRPRPAVLQAGLRITLHPRSALAHAVLPDFPIVQGLQACGTMPGWKITL